jgi:hypothetical protein
LRSRGWLEFRLRSVNGSGWPDTFYVKKGRCVFIEYKTPEGELSDIQEKRIAQLQEERMEVYVIDSVENLKSFFL